MADAQGGLVSGVGIENQGAYHLEGAVRGNTGDRVVDPPDATSLESFFVYVYDANAQFQPDEVAFEASPRRMRIVQGTSGYAGWYVPLGP